MAFIEYIALKRLIPQSKSKSARCVLWIARCDQMSYIAIKHCHWLTTRTTNWRPWLTYTGVYTIYCIKIQYF